MQDGAQYGDSGFVNARLRTMEVQDVGDEIGPALHARQNRQRAIGP